MTSAEPPTGRRAGPSVVISQESLFFPLPITGGIENIVQLTNLEGSKIAFKVRSTVRQRYAVRPTSGVLHPREEALVKFLLDPANMAVDGAVPDETTKDAFLIDFAFVTPVDEDTPSAAFWKKYSFENSTQTGGVTRKRLPCVFTVQEKVPKSLTMHMKPGAPGPTLTPVSAATFSTGQRVKGISLTPNAKRIGAVSFETAEVSPAASPTTNAPAVPAFTPRTAVVTTPAPHVKTIPSALRPSTTPAEVVGPVFDDSETFLSSFLFFRVPLLFAALLLVASFVVALVEEPDASILAFLGAAQVKN